MPYDDSKYRTRTNDQWIKLFVEKCKLNVNIKGLSKNGSIIANSLTPVEVGVFYCKFKFVRVLYMLSSLFFSYYYFVFVFITPSFDKIILSNIWHFVNNKLPYYIKYF